MTHPLPVDHAFVALFVIVWPVYTWLYWFPRVFPRLAAHEPGLRMRVYRDVILEQWALFAMAIAIWAFTARSWDALGFGVVVDLRLGIGLGFVALFVILLASQLRAVNSSAEARGAVANQLGDKIAAIVPRTKAELKRFTLLGFTAGVCEEVLFRGFLIAYLQGWMGLWVAVGVSTVLFSFAHAYMGRSDALRAGAFGLVCGVAYALTGSLWTPILLHAFMDIFSGATIYAAVGEEAPPAKS